MGVDLGAVPVQTPALAGTRPLGLASAPSCPGGTRSEYSAASWGPPAPTQAADRPALLEAEPQVGQGRRKALSSSSSEK